MSAADDLVTWLRRQLDDDAQTFAALDSTALNGIDSTAGWDARAYVERIPAEVDAKRRILADYERYAAERRRAMNGWESSREISPILAALALPYADRPGYRDEWRPA